MSTKAKSKGGDDFRLPSTVVPWLYDLILIPNLTGKSGRFRGEETIHLTVLENVQSIVLNVCGVKIIEATLTNGDTTLSGRVRVDTDTELATISFPVTVEAGEWRLFLHFTGSHNQGLRGFYLSRWEDGEGKKHIIATTQHESTEARKTFPCFDEPAFKAIFKVRLVVDKHLTALSNARRTSEISISRRRKVVEFAPTPKMSTYLTCFIVGELVSSEPRFVNGKELRIWTVLGKEHLTAFALESSARALEWFEEYFGIPYFGGDKIDHVAIPDFEAGAMENVGCVTYRESALLCDPLTATHGEMVSIAETDQHETAHFWFGDLVTMFWWNGLWLNEAFATFMENLCLSKWKPEWKIWDAFALSRATAMRIDGLKSTHPIEMPVNHPDDADELFDAISYEKGGSVLDMIHQFISFEIFRQGIRIYLNRHAYGNTKTSDLWDALEEACHQNELTVPVRKIMDAWIFTAGHPVVSVEAGDKAGTLKLTQSPFQFLNDTHSDQLFPIPMRIAIKNDDGSVTMKTFVFDTKTCTVEVGANFAWANVNAGGSGFYRVRYAADLLSKLTAHVHTDLSAVERFNLVNDAWACVQSGLVTSTDFIALIQVFKGETDPNVMAIVLSALAALHRLLPESNRLPFKAYVRELIRPTFDVLGWQPVTGESVQSTELRASLFARLGKMCADREVIEHAHLLFQAWLTDKTAVDPNLLSAVVSVIAASGDEKLYEQFKSLFQNAATPFEEETFLFGLAQFSAPTLLEKTLAMCFSGEVSVQDSPYLFGSLLGKDESSGFAWEYLRSNWEQIKSTFPTNMVPGMAGSCRFLDTKELAVQVHEFFATHEVKAGTMAVAQMLEQLDIAVRIRQSETARLLDFVTQL